MNSIIFVTTLFVSSVVVSAQQTEICDPINNRGSCSVNIDTDDVGFLLTDTQSRSKRRSVSTWDKVAQWMSANGATVHHGLQVNDTRHAGSTIRGVITTQDLPQSTTLLSIPRQLWLSLSHFPELQNTVLPAGCNKVMFKSGVAVALEEKKGAASFYHTYLAGLPTLADYQSYYPRYMEAPLRADFGALPIVDTVKELQRNDEQLRICFETWRQEPNSLVAELEWSDMLLALAQFRTRCYSAGQEVALLPASDLLNTATILNTNWMVNDQTFTVDLSKDVDGGGELYDSYCPMCTNSAMLLIWGLYLEDNTAHVSDMPECNATVQPSAPDGAHATSASLREATEAALDLSVQSLATARSNGWLAPRCKAETLALTQGPMRCSLARLAWEYCSRIWRGSSSGLTMLGVNAKINAVEEAVLVDSSAIHAIPLEFQTFTPHQY